MDHEGAPQLSHRTHKVPLAACDAESQRNLFGLGGFFRGREEQKERAVETATVSWPTVKRKMDRARISVADLARAAGDYPSNVSAIIHGAQYCGPERMARLVKALRERGVDV
jgi:hypothetical protein